MANLILDDLNPYASLNDVSLNMWDNALLITFSTDTPLGDGQSFLMSNSSSGVVFLKKSGSVNRASWWINVYLKRNGSFTSNSKKFVLCLLDGTSVQCCVTFDDFGNIEVYRGFETTLEATFSAAYSSNSWNHYQIELIVGTTTGEVHIRKNGNTSDDFSATGLNLQATANAYANGIQIQDAGGAGSSIPMLMKDIWVWNDDPASTPNGWLGETRSTWLYPAADTAQKQFTLATPTAVVGQTSNENPNSRFANVVYTMFPLTLDYDGTVSKLTVTFGASAAGHAKCAIYDATGAGGSPGTLLANGVSNEVVNPTAGANDFTFATPPTLAVRTPYWLCILADVNFQLRVSNVSLQQYTETRTYGLGFDSPMIPFSTTYMSAVVTATIALAGNFAAVGEPQEDGTLTYVEDANPGDFDLYANSGMTFTPAQIYAVVVRGFGSKSDAGSRIGALTIKSGAASLDGPAFNLSTQFSNIPYLFMDKDPDTAAVWTVGGVNNLQFGPKVVT